MTIKSLNELKRLLTICRAQGVSSIKVDGMEITIENVPVDTTPVRATPKSVKDTFNELADVKIPTPTAWDSLTDEQKLFYSSENVMDGTQEKQQ